MGKDAYNPARIIDAARGLLADAAARCHAPDRDSEHNVHAVRKALKRVRAYWRLMRYALGKTHSKAGNARCRQAAKQLSAARDHVVMLGTLEAVGKAAGGKTAMAVGQARHAMHAETDPPPTRGIDWALVHDLVRNDDAAWSGLDPSAIDPAQVKRGWQRTRRKAREGYRGARRRLDAESMHEWRKWAKRWLEQETLLHPGKDRRIDRLDRLGDALGEHHDLAVLARRLWRNDRFGGRPQRRVRKTIGKRQSGLEKRSLKLGRKLFA